MILKQMATKAPTFSSNPEALLFPLLHFIADPSDIDSTLNAIFCMLKFPSNDFFSSWGRTNLL